MKNNKAIQIPGKLWDNLNSHLKQSSFKSVDDFIIFILQNYLDQQKSITDNRQSSNDDAAVLKRLEDLGYM